MFNLRPPTNGLNGAIMTNNVFFAIESGKNVMKATSKVRSHANKEFYSLSAVIKQIRTKTMWEAGYKEAFAAIGINSASDLTPVMLKKAAPELVGKTQKGESFIGIWGLTAQKDEKGNTIMDENGNTIMAPILRRVSSWSPNKLLQILAQSQAFVKAANTPKAESAPVAAPIPTGKAKPEPKAKGGKKNGKKAA